RGEEASPVGFGRPDLEVRASRPAQRPRAKECTAQIRSGAATPRDDALLREPERPVRPVEHAGVEERRVRVFGALHVKLVARRPVERATWVCADLGPHSGGTQERERTPRDGRARDVEVDVDAAAAAEMRTAGDVEQAREL